MKKKFGEITKENNVFQVPKVNLPKLKKTEAYTPKASEEEPVANI